ncbi:hypothetical protein MNB_SM-3-1023 [hydrothermal vent metagenome]|uniref:DUF255 domain-containing protein n=1 Tax=hydrothermal vent metagenome TaxID=652676 RepID=A0A1W1D4U0_9ZZZZ
MIKKFTLLFVILFSSLVASELHLAKSYQEGVKEAQRQHKPIFFVQSRHTCKYCVIFEKTTLKDKRVIKALNRDFISVIAFSDDGDYIPRDLWQPATPTIWFLDPKGRPMFQPIPGAIDASSFLQALAIVKTEFDKKGKNR